MTPMQRLERALFDPQRPSRTLSQELGATLGITRAFADKLVASGELSSTALAIVSAEHDLSIHWIVTGEGPEIASRLPQSTVAGTQAVENPGHLKNSGAQVLENPAHLKNRGDFIERASSLTHAQQKMVLGLLQLPIAFAEGDHALDELFECAAMLLRVPAAKPPADRDLMEPFWGLASSCVRAYLLHHPRASMRRARALARTRLGEFVGAA